MKTSAKPEYEPWWAQCCKESFVPLILIDFHAHSSYHYTNYLSASYLHFTSKNLDKGYIHKTSGFIMSGFKTSGFRTSGSITSFITSCFKTSDSKKTSFQKRPTSGFQTCCNRTYRNRTFYGCTGQDLSVTRYLIKHKDESSFLPQEAHHLKDFARHPALHQRLPSKIKKT